MGQFRVKTSEKMFITYVTTVRLNFTLHVQDFSFKNYYVNGIVLP